MQETKEERARNYDFKGDGQKKSTTVEEGFDPQHPDPPQFKMEQP